MGHSDPPIRHHSHQIPQAQLEARVPAHAQNDDLSIEVPSFEQIFDRVERLHSSSSPGEGAFAPEPPARNPNRPTSTRLPGHEAAGDLCQRAGVRLLADMRLLETSRLIPIITLLCAVPARWNQ
jgi:hypothetical protein